MGYVSMEMLFAMDQRIPQDPEEISGFQRVVELSAMRVAPKSGSDDLVYVGEQGPIGIDLSCSREIQDAHNHSFRWWRFEIYSERKGCPIRKGESLVMVDYPYAKLHTHSASFKKGFVNNRPDPSTETFASLDAAITWVDTLKRDYFYTKSGVLAAISKPGGMLDPAQARNYPLHKSRLVIGVCEDLASFEVALLKSVDVERLLRQTEGPIKLGPKAEYPQPIRLPQAVVDDSYALMCISIRQALAGPENDSVAWIGRPVFDKINQLYRDHLFNSWRRYENEQRHLSHAKNHFS